MYPLPAPFMVLATQNPIEEEGTYILPEAQLDRFLLKDVIDYPTADEELEVLDRIDRGILGTRGDRAATRRRPRRRRLPHRSRARVYVDDSIKRYAVAITQATRRLRSVIDPALAEYVEFGASPRSDRPPAGRPGARPAAGSHVRAAGRPAGAAPRRVPPPSASRVPGRRRRHPRRGHHRRRLRGDPNPIARCVFEIGPGAGCGGQRLRPEPPPVWRWPPGPFQLAAEKPERLLCCERSRPRRSSMPIARCAAFSMASTGRSTRAAAWTSTTCASTCSATTSRTSTGKPRHAAAGRWSSASSPPVSTP